jgi:hypothetical protein
MLLFLGGKFPTYTQGFKADGLLKVYSSIKTIAIFLFPKIINVAKEVTL